MENEKAFKIIFDENKVIQKVMETAKSIEGRGAYNVALKIGLLLSGLSEFKKRVSRLILIRKVVNIVVVFSAALVFFSSFYYMPDVEFIAPISKPLDIFQLVAALDSALTLGVAVTIGLFFFSRYISSSLDDACVGQLEAAKKIIHLLDMNHLGKKAITLGFNDSDSENIEYKERFEKSKEYLISVAELVSLTGKAGTFFSELHNSIAVIEKTRELEQLCAIISTSIEYKISRLYKDYEINRKLID